MFRLAMLFLAALAFAVPAEARKPVYHHAPRVADWSRTVSATPAGGFVMGNPAAKAKLVEYGSLTCPHCRHFDTDGAPPLIANYVRSGKASWEFRPFLLNGYDIPATLTAACNGAPSFFPLLRALYAAQPDWTAKMRAIPADRMEAIQKLAPPQQFRAIGNAAGFPAFAAAHGVPAARIENCLASQPLAERFVKSTADATARLKVNATPTFLVNGATVDYSGHSTVWEAVQASLDAALKG
jgi:protein-disulfide isomerase